MHLIAAWHPVQHTEKTALDPPVVLVWAGAIQHVTEMPGPWATLEDSILA